MKLSRQRNRKETENMSCLGIKVNDVCNHCAQQWDSKQDEEGFNNPEFISDLSSGSLVVYLEERHPIRSIREREARSRKWKVQNTNLMSFATKRDRKIGQLHKEQVELKGVCLFLCFNQEKYQNVSRLIRKNQQRGGN